MAGRLVSERLRTDERMLDAGEESVDLKDRAEQVDMVSALLRARRHGGSSKQKAWRGESEELQPPRPP